jgi:hypothetical protein
MAVMHHAKHTEPERSGEILAFFVDVGNKHRFISIDLRTRNHFLRAAIEPEPEHLMHLPADRALGGFFVTHLKSSPRTAN